MQYKLTKRYLEDLKQLIKDHLEDIKENSCYYKYQNYEKDLWTLDYLIDKEIKKIKK